jgi:hypothetical protein
MRIAALVFLLPLGLAVPVSAVQAPGGVLPLKPGVYVAQGSDCGDPSNAAIRIYDRLGIRGSATHACRARVLSRKGSVYQVSQSCIDTPAGAGRRTAERQTIRVADALTFSLSTARGGSSYRYCPPRMLPKWLLRQTPG